MFRVLHATRDVSCVLFVEFFFPLSNERISLLLLLFTYFVREEKRDEIDFELSTMILLKLEALVDFLLSDLDDALVINTHDAEQIVKYTLIA